MVGANTTVRISAKLRAHVTDTQVLRHVHLTGNGSGTGIEPVLITGGEFLVGGSLFIRGRGEGGERERERDKGLGV